MKNPGGWLVILLLLAVLLLWLMCSPAPQRFTHVKLRKVCPCRHQGEPDA